MNRTSTMNSARRTRYRSIGGSLGPAPGRVSRFLAHERTRCEEAARNRYSRVAARRSSTSRRTRITYPTAAMVANANHWNA